MQQIITLAQINPTVGDISQNTAQIIDIIQANPQSDWIVFPEMALTGYPVDDYLHLKQFQQQTQHAVEKITQHVQKSHVVLGAPTWNDEQIFNSALILHNQNIVFTYHKTHLANQGLFYESRNFSTGKNLSTYTWGAYNIGILICEECWQDQTIEQLNGSTDLLIIINASPFNNQKPKTRHQRIEKLAQTLNCPIIYLNMVGGQDEMIFDGASLVADTSNTYTLKRFKTQTQTIELQNNQWSGVPVTYNQTMDENRYDACVLGTYDYAKKNGFKRLILGISGGIDSALTLAMSCEGVGAENVQALWLPSQHNSLRAKDDAHILCQKLGVNLETIDIEPIYKTFLETLGLEDNGSITAQNLQARIRGNLLMALSNQRGALLLSTSNKSEIAMGYSTLYGDSCGGYAPLKDLYKTQVYNLSCLKTRLTCHILLSIIEASPSAELAPNQTDQDTLPDYALIDQFLHQHVEHKQTLIQTPNIQKIATRLYQNEFKRSQMPLGPSISEQSFGKDRHVPVTFQFSPVKVIKNGHKLKS